MAAFPVPRFDQFYRYPELTRLLQDYAQAMPGLVQLFGIESPGITASLALAGQVAQALTGDGDHAAGP